MSDEARIQKIGAQSGMRTRNTEQARGSCALPLEPRDVAALEPEEHRSSAGDEDLAQKQDVAAVNAGSTDGEGRERAG